MGCEGAPLHFGLREAHAYGLNFTGLAHAESYADAHATPTP